MNRYLPYAHSFNEELLAKELYMLKEAKVRSIINYNIRNSSFVTIFSLVSRYLLHIKKISAIETRNCLRKYAVILSYLYLSSAKGPFELFRSIEIDEVITNIDSNILTFNVQQPGIFNELYNDINYYKNINQLIKKVKRYYNEKIAEAIYKVLRGEFNYFSKKTNIVSFVEYPDMKRFDMIVAEAMLNNTFYSFAFEVDYESFKENFININPTNDQIRMAITFVGYMVYDIFNKGNFNFQEEINFISNKMFVLSTLDKGVSVNNMNLNFIKKEGNQTVIDWEDFKEFKFKYNDIEATFSYKKIQYSML